MAIVLASLLLAPRLVLCQTESSLVNLRIDPLLIAEAAEVWTLIAAPENPIWPGWNASDTPLLFYLPGEQDVLINHPRPPAGFMPYTGTVPRPSIGTVRTRRETWPASRPWSSRTACRI